MSQTNWEADKMLDVYIHDYFIKRNLHATASAFQAEGKVSSDPVAIDAPGGFLFEWWSVFWDIFIARTNEKHSEVASSYIEIQLMKAREQQQQQPLQRQAQQQQQQQQQSQHRDGAHIVNGNANGIVSSDSLLRQNPGAANALATKMYEERLKFPVKRELDEASMKQQQQQRFGENVGHLMDSNPLSMLKPSATPGQPSRHVLHGSNGGPGGPLQQVQSGYQQVPGPTQDTKNEVNMILNSRASGVDGSLIGVPAGSNQSANNLTLKGWPLTGLDQLRTGLQQQQKSFMQSPHSIPQLQFLNPHQQQLLLQAQQNLASPSAGDIDGIRLRMLLNNKNMVLVKDGQLNSVGDAIPNIGSPLQTQSSFIPRGDNDMILKKIAQLQSNSQQKQHLQQHALSSQQSQIQTPYLISKKSLAMEA